MTAAEKNKQSMIKVAGVSIPTAIVLGVVHFVLRVMSLEAAEEMNIKTHDAIMDKNDCIEEQHKEDTEKRRLETVAATEKLEKKMDSLAAVVHATDTKVQINTEILKRIEASLPK